MKKMKKITEKELEVFLRKHKLWLTGDKKGERANLSGANLSGADLSGANLIGVNLSGANLIGVNLRSVNLIGADLSGANLSGANLSGADLSGADLSGADLSGANLWNADLWNANLSGANLSGADLRNAKNVDVPIACPEKGSFTAFKKARGYIVELSIPSDAKRCSATSRKCRCDKADVVSITNLDGTDSGLTQISSSLDKDFVYKVGSRVSVDNFDNDRFNECSTGIHFFITRKEAEDYIN